LTVSNQVIGEAKVIRSQPPDVIRSPAGAVEGTLYHAAAVIEVLKCLGIVPAGLDCHILLDNYGTHKTAMIRMTG